MSAYKSVFLIPIMAKKELGESGWLFQSDRRLGTEVLDILKDSFPLKLEEEYLGIEAYSGTGIKVEVIHDEDGFIETIFIQLWSVTVDELTKVFHNKRLDMEVFVPKVEGVGFS